MNNKMLVAAIVMLRAAVLPAQNASSSDAIRYLAPHAFPRLPAAVRKALDARGCQIPQPWDTRSPQNIIHGSFTTAAANEWAILCSSSSAALILVYRIRGAATADLVDSLQSSGDGAWIQDVGGGRTGYSRLIQTRPERKIRAWRVDVDHRAIPQPIDHDAIEEIFLDKYAWAFYCARGRWYRQLTAD